MKVILFGATGMIGQAALRECLVDDEVQSVLAVVRRSTGKLHEKLREIVHQDFADFSAIEGELAGYDACLFCLGTSSAGMKEADYTRVTYDFAIAAAQTLVKQNPGMTFIFVSGAGTDSTEKGGSMWARVKGKTENALLQMPFKDAYMFRPGFVQPLHGVLPGSKWIRVLYSVMGPLYPVWKLLFPKYVTTSEGLGRAMLHVAKHGAPKHVLENADFAGLVG